MDPIDTVLKNEGSAVTNDPKDGGGRTQFGISEKFNPVAWADGKVTEAEARAIYEAKYVKSVGFDKIPDIQLRTQCIDTGVLSGPAIAIQKLQGILKVPVDGILGPGTLQALAMRDSKEVNNLLVAERVRMICKIVAKNPTQLGYLVGWADRALQFII